MFPVFITNVFLYFIVFLLFNMYKQNSFFQGNMNFSSIAKM